MSVTGPGITSLSGLSIGVNQGGPAGSAISWLSSATVAVAAQNVPNATTSTQTIAYGNVATSDAVLSFTLGSALSDAVAVASVIPTAAGVLTLTLANASASTVTTAANTARVVIGRF